MEDTPMMAQGLRYNWTDPGAPLVPDVGIPGKRPHRQCWRFWPHPWHTHMGPRGNESIAVCHGVPYPKTDNGRWVHG